MKHLIIGNGVAGITAAFEIRKADPSASIQIVTEEPYPFYSRIRLPEFLAGSLDEQGLIIRKPSWYEENRIVLSLNTKVAAIDPVASMAAIDNPKLRDVGEQVRAKLKAVIDNL